MRKHLRHATFFAFFFYHISFHLSPIKLSKCMLRQNKTNQTLKQAKYIYELLLLCMPHPDRCTTRQTSTKVDNCFQRLKEKFEYLTIFAKFPAVNGAEYPSITICINHFMYSSQSQNMWKLKWWESKLTLAPLVRAPEKTWAGLCKSRTPCIHRIHPVVIYWQNWY